MVAPFRRQENHKASGVGEEQSACEMPSVSIEEIDIQKHTGIAARFRS